MSENIPVRSSAEESADLFPGKESAVFFDTSDPVNDGVGFSPDKYSPQYPGSSLSSEDVNSRASAPRRKV